MIVSRWAPTLLKQFAEFNVKLFFHLLFSKTDYFLANDLDTLVPSYIISKLRRKKIFYDTHEYYTGVPELKNSPLKRKIWKFFEDWIFPQLKVVYTVNDSVRKLYYEEYGYEINVIRNVPTSKKINPKDFPKHWKGKIILLMQGIGINKNRGGLQLLEAMKFLPDNYYLVYIGGGNLWSTIAEKRLEWNLAAKVEMIHKLPPEELKQYTPLAHLGFSLDGFDDVNFLFNLPNKIFDYIHAGVPVVATAIPEVKHIVESFQCGICSDTQNPKEIALLITSLMNDSERYQQLRTNTLKASRELCWENEKGKLIAIYQPFL
jgi:glycosyltransferase involved in cell wall biosynthesis